MDRGFRSPDAGWSGSMTSMPTVRTTLPDGRPAVSTAARMVAKDWCTRSLDKPYHAVFHGSAQRPVSSSIRGLSAAIRIGILRTGAGRPNDKWFYRDRGGRTAPA
jgi:hypothetical protein